VPANEPRGAPGSDSHSNSGRASPPSAASSMKRDPKGTFYDGMEYSPVRNMLMVEVRAFFWKIFSGPEKF